MKTKRISMIIGVFLLVVGAANIACAKTIAPKKMNLNKTTLKLYVGETTKSMKKFLGDGTVEVVFSLNEK